jgi:hypothetical protein
VTLARRRPGHFMTHLSDASADPPEPDVERGEHVTDDEYRKARSR